jgi:hypothetical protein
MTKQQEAAINRACAHECVRKELVEALESIVGIAQSGPWFAVSGGHPAIEEARKVLARAKEQ